MIDPKLFPSPSVAVRYNKTARTLKRMESWCKAITSRLDYTPTTHPDPEPGIPTRAYWESALGELSDAYLQLDTKSRSLEITNARELFDAFDLEVKETWRYLTTWYAELREPVTVLDATFGPMPPIKNKLEKLIAEAKLLDPEYGDSLEAIVNEFVDESHSVQQAIKANSWKHRIAMELLWYTREGSEWFVVFDTLTANDTHCDRLFDRSELTYYTEAWQSYIQTIRDDVRKAMWHQGYRGKKGGKDFRSIPVSEAHRYISVVEYGGKTGRPHIHVLHCMKVLPEGCVDPNAGASKAGLPTSRRQIDHFRKYWNYGFTMPIACRFSKKDAFARIGWVWPTKKGKHMQVEPERSPIRLANYLSKYISKDIEDKESWRIKATHGYGLGAYNAMMEQMPTHLLRKVLIRPELLRRVMGAIHMPMHTGWQRPMLESAQREWLTRMRKRRPGVLSRLTRDFKPKESLYARIVTTVSRSFSPDHFPRPNSGTILTELTKPMDISEDDIVDDWTAEKLLPALDSCRRNVLHFLRSQFSYNHFPFMEKYSPDDEGAY